SRTPGLVVTAERRGTSSSRGSVSAAEGRRLRLVHTMGQRAASTNERLMHTRAGVQHAAKTRDAAHEQPRDALGGFGPGQPCLPTHAPCAGKRQAEQETAAALRRRTRRRLPGGHGPLQWVVSLQKVSDAGGSSGCPPRA